SDEFLSSDLIWMHEVKLPFFIEKINFFQSNYFTCHVKQKNPLGKIKLFQFESMNIKRSNILIHKFNDMSLNSDNYIYLYN
ncbi:hypothetical protein BpHYR1_022793, partial [Brachionus plicatilis]